uniref:Uncharacterized protein n=1 Tax=Ralstonia solanacearum TaxID=305 RepID=A0A0S4V4T9_RALSL|nr:protein of unknown function [Ralstonia solanacearum]
MMSCGVFHVARAASACQASREGLAPGCFAQNAGRFFFATIRMSACVVPFWDSRNGGMPSSRQLPP